MVKRNYKNSPWTEDISNLAHTMWAQGDSSSLIANTISTSDAPISRNAVIGRAHRKHWGGRPARIAKVQAPRAPKKRGPKRRPVYHVPTSSMTLQAVAPTPIVEPDVTDMHLVSFADRKHDGCCWPIGDPREPGFGFCDSDRVEGSSYCAGHTHTSIQHVSPPQRYVMRRPLYR
jgi:GcrA cell cycle regulator